MRLLPHLTSFQLKASIAGTGFAAGLAGMALERRWLVGVGVGLLAVAFLLRFSGRTRASS